VLVGALLNLSALVEELRWDDPENVLLVCAGTFEDFALEDAVAAGLLAREFPEAALTDAARATVASANLFPTPLDALRASQNGKVLASKGRDAEVEWCAQLSRYTVVGLMDGAVIRPLG
jgi:2-phosphosulfolactate phosphatase